MERIDIHIHNIGRNQKEVAAAVVRSDIGKCLWLGDVLRFGTQPTKEEVTWINDATAEFIGGNPRHYYGACFLNPNHSAEFNIDELEKRILRQGFKAVKLDISLNCRSPKMAPIMEKLIELDVPLLHHSWYRTNKPAEESAPADIAILAGRFPQAKIIMAHLIGCGCRGVEDIAFCENVWCDTSGAPPVAGIIEYAFRRIGAERIVFGSDAPYRDVACQLGKVLSARIPWRSKELILGENAKRLLKL